MADFASQFSMLPVLFAIELLAIHFAVRHGVTSRGLTQTAWIYGLLAIVVVWGAATTWAGLAGVYQTPEFLASYPVVWLPVIPVFLVAAPLVMFSTARDAVRELIDATPVRWIVGIHVLRVLAIGTLFKAWKGEFSMSFAMFVGIPDLLFGLSAIAMTWLAINGRVRARGLMVWNVLGLLVIYPGAVIVGQMSLPGALNAIVETPSAASLFEFPMVLGPSLVVPIFLMMNAFVALRLFEQAGFTKSDATVAA